MGGCCSNSVKSVKMEDDEKWNPIKQLLAKYSIERLKNQWGVEEFQLMINRLKSKNRYGYNCQEFIELFPNLKPYSTQTKRRIFQLCNTSNASNIQANQIVQALTILHKSGDPQLIGELIFYIYSDQDNPKHMPKTNLDLFFLQNQKHLLSNSQTKKSTHQDSMEKQQIFTIKQFQKILQFYDLNSFLKLFEENVDEIQLQIAKKIRQMGQIDRAVGQSVFVFEYQWFLQWKRYMADKFSIQFTFSNQKNYQPSKFRDPLRSTINQRKATRPGIIKNSILLIQDNFQIKTDLIQFKDYVFLPVWLSEKIISIYKTIPIIQKIYPDLHEMLILQVQMNLRSGMFEKKVKKYRVKLKQTTFKEYFLKKSINIPQNYVFMVKTPWKQNWQKIKSIDTPIRNVVDHKMIYVCYFPQKFQKLFLDVNNAQEVKGKKIIKNRLKNFGSQLSFPFQGAIKQGYVYYFKNKQVVLIYKENNGYFTSIDVPLQVLQEYNLSQLQKKVQRNYLAGLTNFSNNCYINSIMQCILRTPLFGDYLQKQFTENQNVNTFVLFTIYQIYKKSKQINIIDTRELKRDIEKHFPIFQGDSHQDAQQLLNSMLTCLSEQIKDLQQFKRKKSFRVIDDSDGTKNKRIIQFFSGMTQTVTQCEKCKNKRQIQQPFFTYHLSLPEHLQNQIFFTFVPKYEKDCHSTSYGMTLETQIKNSQFMEKAAALLSKDLNNIFFVYTSNGQIIGKLENEPNRQTFEYCNFNMKIFCYEIQKPNDEKVIKVQLQMRTQNQEKKNYNLIADKPFILNLKSSMDWITINSQIFQIINNHRVEKPNIQNSEHYTIRIISRFSESYRCFFCRSHFRSFYKKQWFFQDVCNCQQFQNGISDLKEKRLQKNFHLIIITVDFKNPSFVDFNKKPIEDLSYEKAMKLNEKRKDFLDQILKNNFDNLEKINVTCQEQQCDSISANRFERISVFPNILLLHLARFRYKDGAMIKMQNNVVYPQKFDFKNTLYNLYAVVVHKGHCNGGHYYAYVKCNKLWYKCDDEVVCPATENEIISEDAYILFYCKDDFEPSLQSLVL